MSLPTFEQARRIVEQHARSIRASRTEQLALIRSAGRILAQTISSDRDLPPFPRAARDGFALRADDVGRVPVTLKAVAEIKAGMDVSGIAIGPAECAEIMTGAPAPTGTDAVVMVEYTSRRDDQIEIQRSVVHGENIVPRGSEAKQGQVLLEPGVRLNPAALAVAASIGVDPVTVFAKPRVAILSTGDELVPVDAQPLPYQIRNSNSHSLAAQVQNCGALPVALSTAPDEPHRLRELIQEGLHSDLLLLTGGVSMGKYDLVEVVLKELGAGFIFTGAQIQPGKPIVFGEIKGKYFFGLPGNPVSTMVTFELFARPIIDALSGAQPAPLRFLSARLRSDIRTKTGLTRFLPARFSGEFAETEVELARWQGSGDVASTARANCFAVIPPDRDHIPAGEFISVLLM